MYTIMLTANDKNIIWLITVHKAYEAALISVQWVAVIQYS